MTKQRREEPAKAPVYASNYGNVRASIWLNEAEGRSYYNVTLGRRYRDANSDSISFSQSLNGAGDVVHAIYALERVLEAIERMDQSEQEEVRA